MQTLKPFETQISQDVSMLKMPGTQNKQLSVREQSHSRASSTGSDPTRTE